jgi:hypothetical protein
VSDVIKRDNFLLRHRDSVLPLVLSAAFFCAKQVILLRSFFGGAVPQGILQPQRRGAFGRPRRFTRSLFSPRSNHNVRKLSVGGAVLDRTFRWPPSVTAGDLDDIGAPAQVRAHHHHFRVTQTALARAGVRWRRSPCRSRDYCKELRIAFAVFKSAVSKPSIKRS